MVTNPWEEYRSIELTFSGDIAATDNTLGTAACPIMESSITRCCLVMYTLSFWEFMKKVLYFYLQQKGFLFLS